MNQFTKKSPVAVGVALLALLGTIPATSAQENYVVAGFDTEEDAFRWSRWWGNAPQVYEFDPSVDAAANANSGSLKATVDFDLAAWAGDNQFAAQGSFLDPTIDGTQYTNLTFQIRWDSSSPVTAGGDHGYLEYGLRNSDFSQTWLGGQSIPASAGNTWLTINAPIDPATAKLEAITGVVLKLWSGGDGGLTGQSVFWLDNVTLLANTNTAPPPPPSLRIAEATPGLRLAATAADQYQRQNIRTQAADAEGNPTTYSWVGNAQPVSYAITIDSFPDAAHSGFQAHLLLVPEAGMPYGPGDSAIDWNAPQVVFVQIANNADGSATARFMYKTNLPSGNSMFWNTDPTAGPVGTLASISDASPVGTWTVTLRNNTEITLTTPSGSVTNVSMPAAAAELFADPLFAYVGIQPNNPGNLGQSATLGRVRISGVATPVDDTFNGETLDAGKWAVAAADATGLIPVPTTARYWLSWDAPATGFVVQAAPTLSAGAWVDPTLGNILQMGTQKTVLVPATSLPSAGAGYFRLIKP